MASKSTVKNPPHRPIQYTNEELADPAFWASRHKGGDDAKTMLYERRLATLSFLEGLPIMQAYVAYKYEKAGGSAEFHKRGYLIVRSCFPKDWLKANLAEICSQGVKSGKLPKANVDNLPIISSYCLGEGAFDPNLSSFWETSRQKFDGKITARPYKGLREVGSFVQALTAPFQQEKRYCLAELLMTSKGIQKNKWPESITHVDVGRKQQEESISLYGLPYNPKWPFSIVFGLSGHIRLNLGGKDKELQPEKGRPRGCRPTIIRLGSLVVFASHTYHSSGTPLSFPTKPDPRLWIGVSSHKKTNWLYDRRAGGEVSSSEDEEMASDDDGYGSDVATPIRHQESSSEDAGISQDDESYTDS